MKKRLMVEQQQQQQLLLDWSDKQRRILTADGKAEEYYCAERGFPFVETELPHYYLLNSNTRQVFREWRDANNDNSNSNNSCHNHSPIVGAWNRPLFYGGWEHSTDRDERVYNLQTNTLFVDLRIPVSRDEIIFRDTAAIITSLEDLNADQLRYYARQHVFAGYSRLNYDDKPNMNDFATTSSPFVASCDRHHCIDWNFVGTPRSRPNKWWIELLHPNPSSCGSRQPPPVSTWKEWAFATDVAGQHYYCERWERHNNNNNNNNTATSTNVPVVALRKREGRDGVLVVVGGSSEFSAFSAGFSSEVSSGFSFDHFNYCLERQLPEPIKDRSAEEYKQQAGSLISLVDQAISHGDLDTARAWLSTEGGHGRIIPSKGWIIDCAIEFWKEGTPLWTKDDDDDVHVEVEGDSVLDCTVTWKGEAWEIFESSLKTVDGIKQLFDTAAIIDDQKGIRHSML